LTRFEAKTQNDGIITSDYLQRKWTFIIVGSKRCDLYCEANLFKTRQARLALGENLRRVQRLYLITVNDSIGELPPVLEQHPRMTVASLQAEAQKQVLETLGEEALGKVFLVDPLGNVMMRYNNEATAKGMVKDLQHLIRASRIG
jgi:cytochrome oxidase Cu insertion factor (SCO1/SenC/PrrC family)